MIPRSSPAAALDLAYDAGEFYMKAFQSVRSRSERQRLEKKLDEVVTLGEYLKLLVHGLQIPPSQARAITPRETVALVQSSKLHGDSFLPWRNLYCSPGSFSLKPNQQAYMYVPSL